MASPPRMIWPVRGCGRVRVAPFLNGYRKLLGTFRDLVKTQLAPPVVNLHPSVFPFAHRHPTLGRRIVPARPFHLIEAIVVPHHPVITQRALRFHPENLLLPTTGGRRPMIFPLGARVAVE